jgi:hypothetical protein
MAITRLRQSITEVGGARQLLKFRFESTFRGVLFQCERSWTPIKLAIFALLCKLLRIEPGLMYHWQTPMRGFSALLITVLGLGLGAEGAFGQACVGLQCQQTSCPGSQTTSITGTVYAPNGTDPLPNVTVYIPNAPVAAFTPGVECPVVGAPPSGSPLLGTETDVNGNFTLIDVPVGTNIPLVIISGRWRRQLVIPGTAACQNTALPTSFAVMPQNQSQGDIPKIAIATGAVDQVECVLRKMGISDSEFTDPTGTGRINLFGGGGASGSGAVIDTGTPTQAALMGNQATLNAYDVLMLPCEGNNYLKPAQELANLINFANAGGRVYSSHYSYSWMYRNPPFDGTASWIGTSSSPTPDPGTATVDTSFSAGQTLATWLQEVGATTTLGQMQLSTLRKDTNGVIAPTRSWLTLNNSNFNNPVMQFVFDTPIAPSGTVINQCGRVLYNEYHVENGSSSQASHFPSECSSSAMTPQEKLLEYMLFELTSEGGQPTLDPTTKDFGSQAIGFVSPVQTFTWSNNSSFTSQVSAAAITGSTDFSIVSNNCSSVPGGSSCQITVVFSPTALGARTGTLTVASSGNTLSASLTGTGTPGYSLSGSSLTFGNLDITGSATQSLTLTSLASGPLPIPPFVTNGQYSVSTAACGSSIAAGATCPIKVTFLPTTTGAQAGTLGVNSTSLLYNGLSAAMTGTGVDFTITLSPTSGHVVAGDGTTTTATLTPLAGFSSPVTVTCVVASSAAASACNQANASAVPPATDVISLSTTSQYTVIGYGGFGGGGYLWLIAVGSGLLLWRRRKDAGALLRSGLLVLMLAALSVSVTGCSGKLPAQNAVYTGPGAYTVTVNATDGFLTRTATYTLTVTAK